MRLFLIALLAALPLAALDPSKPLAAYQRQNWQTESGLPQNTVHAIVQTHDGYLWLATEGGLVRFDGLKFTVFDSQNTPTIRSSNVRALLEDREQRLWVGTADGITVLHGTAATVFTREQGLPSNSVWSISEDAEGRAMVVTAGGSVEFRNGKFELKETKETAENNSAVSLRDRHGAVWVANHGITRTFDGRTETLSPNDPLTSDTILSMFEDREGDLWFGSESNGVTVFRDPKITTYTTKDGLVDDLTRCVYQDHQGTIWIGTNGGLTKIASGRFSNFTVKDGLSSNLVSPWEKLPEETCWWERKMG